MDAPTDLFAMEDFRRPGYLVSWLSEALSKHESGIFHLEMEKGMGKSTFVQALDPTRWTGPGGLALEDTTVRGYLINSPIYASLEAYCNSLPEIFNHNEAGDWIFEGSEVCLQYLEPEGSQTAEQLSKFLHFYRDAFQSYYGTSRLLLVVDGLDEIPPEQARILLDALPSPGELRDGTYILLTSRLFSELPPQLRGAAALREVTENLRVGRLHHGYQDMLEEYARETLLNDWNSPYEIDTETLVEKAEDRFLHLRPLRCFLESFRGERLQESLPKGKALLERSLKRLRALYGEEFYREASKLAAILASAYEPLTLEEVAFLAGRGGIDSRLLACMAELRAFLKTDRSRGENLIFMHAEWKAAGKRALEGTIRDLIEGWIQECSERDHDKREPDNAGRSYLLSHLAEYCAEYGFDEPLESGVIAALLADAAEGFKEETRDFHAVERLFLMLDSAVKIYEKLLELGGDVEDALALAYCERGAILLARQEEQRALADCNRALDIRLRLDEEDRLPSRSGLEEVYLARGNVFKKMNKAQFAEADFAMAVQIRERQDQGDRLRDRDLPAQSYRIRGDFYKYDGEDIRFRPSMLAGIHANKGKAFDKLGQPERAVAEFDSALAILGRMDGEGRLLDKSGLAKLHETRGDFFRLHAQPERAVAEYDRIFEILMKSRKRGYYVDQSDLANLYCKRGAAFMDQRQPERAIADFDEAIDMMDMLNSDRELADDRDFVIGHMLRGDAYAERRSFEEALADYDAAVDLMGGRYSKTEGSDPMALSEALEKRGAVRAELQDTDGAAADYDQAAELVERALALSRFFRRDETRETASKAAGAAKNTSAGPNERSLFLDNVRDSILGRREWRCLGEDETRPLRLERNAVILRSYMSSWRFETIRFDLPFYGNASLLELCAGTRFGSLWFLDNGGSLALLDGTSAPIRFADAACPLKLSRENLVAYLRFFNFFVHGVEGPFFIADDLMHPMIDASRLTTAQRALLEKNLKAPELIEERSAGLYRVRASVLYGDALLSATFEIRADGRVEMVDDTRIVDGLPVNELNFYIDQGMI